MNRNLHRHPDSPVRRGTSVGTVLAGAAFALILMLIVAWSAGLFTV